MPGVSDSIACIRNRAVPVGTVHAPEDEHIAAIWEAIVLLAAELDAPDPAPVLPG